MLSHRCMAPTKRMYHYNVVMAVIYFLLHLPRVGYVRFRDGRNYGVYILEHVQIMASPMDLM